MKRIYGRRPVEEFFRSRPDPSSIRRIYVSPSLPRKFMTILAPFLKGTRERIEERPRSDLDRICEGNHQGIIVEITDEAAKTTASGSQKLPRPDPAGTLKDALEEYPGLYVVTDRIQDQQNLGSLIRSAEALGAMALVITGKGARPGEVTDRISAGGSQHLPVFVMANPDSFLREAAERNYWILAAAGIPEDEDRPAPLRARPSGLRAERMVEGESGEFAREIEIGYDEDELEEQAHETRFEGRGKKRHGPVYLRTDELDGLPENGRYVLLIGHEGEGLKPSLLERADFILSIPLYGALASLNAAVAGAILIERLLSVRPPEQYG